jgi:preprotein translocase subunit SecE
LLILRASIATATVRTTVSKMTAVLAFLLFMLAFAFAFDLGLALPLRSLFS